MHVLKTMMQGMLRLAIFFIFLHAHNAAQAQFQLQCETISAIGSSSSSTEANLLTIAGQPFPVEPIANSNFVLHPGFIPCLSLGLITSVDDGVVDTELPKAFALRQNYPNPFNPATEIIYELPKAAYVNLAVFNLLGQKVKTLINATVQAGKYSARWDGKDETGKIVASGIYLYRLESGGQFFQKSMTLLK